MALILKPKRGTSAPTTSDIVSGEIAIDTSAQLLYINDNGSIKTIGDGTGSSGTVTEAFKTISVSGQSDVVADSATDTLALVAGTGMTLATNASGDSITFTSTATGTVTEAFKTISVSGQSDVVADSATDTLALVAGTGMTLTTNASGDSITFASSGSTQNLFETIAVSGQSSVVADSATDTLTLVAGTGITLTTNASTDTITFASTGSYSDSDVDTHLNRSTASTNEVLSWNGSDYDWVAQSGGGATLSYLEAGMIEYEYTATSNQTTFSGSDTNSATLSYTANSVLVFLNGVLQDDGVDYTATNGTSVVFSSALTANDEVRIVAFTNVTTSASLQDPTKLDAISTVNNQAAYSLTLSSSAYTPSSQNALIVSLNGITQEPGDSFTISGSTITFSPALVTGDVVDYIVDMGRAVTIGEYSGDLAVGGELEVTGDIIGDLRGATLFKAQAGENLSKGDVVYISGISGNTTIVSKADADDAAKMPAFGLVAAAASSGNPVDVYTFGELSGLDTSSFSEGDELFVSTTAGTLTNSAPAGESSKLQKIAKVTRSDNSAGSVFIMGAGRSNATPNLDDGDIFIGNASNQAVTASLNTKIEDYLDAGTSTPSFSTINSGNITTTGYIAGPSTFTIDPAAVGDNTGTLVIAGNLQVDGTTTTINSTTMTVDDLNITLASGAANAAAANGAGITVDGASATLTYNSTPDAWSFNKNVGIGTSSPDQLLDVGDHTAAGNRSIRISQRTATNSTTYGGLEFFYDNSAGTTGVNAAIKYAAGPLRNDGELTFHTGASGSISERLRIDHNGNVGIGTTPSDELHIKGIDPALRLEDTSAVGYARLEATNGSMIYEADQGNTVGNSTHIFKVDSDEKMRINSSGNVGIGTASPDANLEIREDNASGLGAALSLTNSNTSGATGNSVAIGLSAYAHTTIDSSSYRGAIIRGETTAAGNGHSILFETSDTSAVPAERVRIDHDGKVGIGITNPAADLVVAGSSSGEYDALILRNSSGVDTSSTSITFEVSGGTHGTEGATAAKISALREGGGTTGALLFHTTSSGTSAERMRIDSSGNVLVGSTTLDQANNSNTANCGVNLFADGALSTSRNGNIVAYFNRLSSDGPIKSFAKAVLLWEILPLIQVLYLV